MIPRAFGPFSSPSVANALELTVANLANPTELNSYGVAVPDWKLCKTVGAGTDDSTLYRLDVTSAATNAPYVVASVTAGLKWVAIAGRYGNSALTVNGGLATLSGLTVSSNSAITGTETVTGLLTASSALTVASAATLSGTTTVVDGNFSILGSSDPTKKIKFEADTQGSGFTLTFDVGAQTASRSATAPVLTGNSILTLSNATLTSTRVPFATTNGILTDSADLTFSGTLLTLGTGVVSGITIAATTGTTVAVNSASNTAQTIAGGLSLDNAGGLAASTAPALRLNGTSPGDTIAVGSSWTTSKFDSQGTVWTSRTIGGAIILNQGASDRPEISWYRGSRSYPEFSMREHATGDTGGQIYAGPGTGAPTLIVNVLATGISIPVVTASTSGTTGSLVVAGGIGSSGSAHNFLAGSVATSAALITASKTSTATSGNDWSALAVTTLNPAGASTQNASALAGNVTLASGASGISGSIVGLDGAIDADATANTFANTTALRGTLRKGGANTLTVGTAVEAALSTSAAGTITSAHGFYMSAMNNSGGATITTAYGLRIANVTVGATNYAIFTGSGVVSIGDTTDSTSTTTGCIQASGGIGVAKRLTLDGATGKTIKYVNGTANAAVAVTFGAVGPTGSTAGNQLGWVRIDIGGTDRYIPYW